MNNNNNYVVVHVYLIILTLYGVCMYVDYVGVVMD